MPRKTKQPPSAFSALPARKKAAVARGIISAFRRTGLLGQWKGRGKYDTVTRDVELRERLYAETGGEESALTISERNRLVALVRNLERNSEHLNGLLTQLDLNVVGTAGGKAHFEFPDEFAESADLLHSAFGNWARECEFFDGHTLQTLIKLAVRTKYTTGRAVLLFDDGLVCDSGKVIVFEGDAVAGIPEREFKKRFPFGWSQHQGLIKDEVGRTRGAFCSMSQRGVPTFERLVDEYGRLAVWALVKDPDASWLDTPFTIFQHVKRVNQIVSVPCVAPSVGSIMDLEALAKYEMQSAKKAAQTVATVTQPEGTGGLGDGLDPDSIAPIADSATDEELAAAVASAVGGVEDAGSETLELPEIDSAGAIYDVLPPGLKMELLNPSHPNGNVIGMVTWIKQNASWANGLAGLFATGKADSSYSASLVEQAITWPKFEDEQQSVKNGILDWLVLRWFGWARRRGMIPGNLPMPHDWIRMVEYTFPRKREADGGKEQSAIAQGFRNGTITLHDVIGPAWRKKVEQQRREREAFEGAGLIYPATQTVNGTVGAPQSEEDGNT